MKNVKNDDAHLRDLVYNEMREKRHALQRLWKIWDEYKETIGGDLDELDSAVDAVLIAHAAGRFEDYDRLLEAKRQSAVQALDDSLATVGIVRTPLRKSVRARISPQLSQHITPRHGYLAR